MIEFFKNGGIPMIVINLLALVLIIFTFERIISLFVKKNFAPDNLTKRLLLIKFVGLATALVGIIGTLLGIYMSCKSSDRIIENYGGVFPIYRVISIAFSTTIWGLTISLLAAIVYFVLKASVIKARNKNGINIRVDA
jgi:biopolymer transport protein ExbB/TolQ